MVLENLPVSRSAFPKDAAIGLDFPVYCTTSGQPVSIPTVVEGPGTNRAQLRFGQLACRFPHKMAIRTAFGLMMSSAIHEQSSMHHWTVCFLVPTAQAADILSQKIVCRMRVRSCISFELGTLQDLTFPAGFWIFGMKGNVCSNEDKKRRKGKEGAKAVGVCR